MSGGPWFFDRAGTCMKDDPYSCHDVVAIEQEPRHHLIVANEFVRAFAVEIAPHDRTLCHHHTHEYLMYVAGDAQIVSAPRDGDPKMHSYPDGDCELSPPGLVHVVENLTDAPFRNLLVELLPAVDDVQRGPNPKVISAGRASVTGDAKLAQRFGNERISVFLLEVPSGSQIEIFGPAIAAAPYEHPVELEPSQGSAHTLAHFRDLYWLEPSKAAALHNRGKTAAKIVLIAVGRE